jgi:hypothetical protein
LSINNNGISAIFMLANYGAVAIPRIVKIAVPVPGARTFKIGGVLAGNHQGIGSSSLPSKSIDGNFPMK